MQNIIKRIGVDDPAVWKYLLTLALRQLGDQPLEVSMEALDHTPGAGVLSLLVTGDKLGIAFIDSTHPEQVVQWMRERRRRSGHADDTTMPIDTRRQFDFTKKQQ